MVNDEHTVSQKLAQPPDGGVLVVHDEDGEWKVIWRDDAEAKRWGAHPDDCWFHDDNSDPMALCQRVKWAKAVYAVREPVAVFRD